MAGPDRSVTVEVIQDLPDWQDYLRGHAEATVYHSPLWGRVMRDAYKAAPYYLTARRDGRTVGVLQLVRQKSMLFGTHLCSLPYFDASGILADDESARAALLRQAADLRKETGAAHAEIREMAEPTEGLPVRTDKVTMWLEIPPGRDAMWKQLKGKVRNEVRKAEKSDLEVIEGGAELVDEFHVVYARRMRDLGSPPHGRRFFRLAAEAFANETRLWVLRHEGRAVAASFTLTDSRGFRVPWSAADARFRKLEANRLLYWHMLARAADDEAKIFDFGRSSQDSGTYEFKEEWGAEPVPLYWTFLLPAGESLPDLRPDSPKYRMMVACWRKLPVWAARALGARLIGKLS